MRPSTSQSGGRRRFGRWAVLAALVAIVAAFALPSSASAASCPVTPGVFATAWIGGSGSLHNDLNWTNGTPSGSCDVSIAAAGSYTVTMTGGANAKSLTLGGVGSTPHLVISDESPNTNFDAQPAGITIPPPPPPAVPDTKLGKRPAAKVKTKQAKAKVKFTFSATVAGSTFQCKLDKGAYKACASPKTYKVKPGKHTFSVRAVGPGGTDATPATFRFKVVKEKS